MNENQGQASDSGESNRDTRASAQSSRDLREYVEQRIRAVMRRKAAETIEHEIERQREEDELSRRAFVVLLVLMAAALAGLWWLLR